MLTLQNIIDEADTLVPNAFTPADKVAWLNVVNQAFFDVVKIPLHERFNVTKEESTYTLDSGIRAKNIDKVTVGYSDYDSALTAEQQAGRALWDFNDSDHKLTLLPTPIQSDFGVVRYFRIGTTTFVSTTLTANPDAPPEYHHLYVLGLAERIAQALDDADKANNYGAAFMDGLNVAAQQYRAAGEAR